MHSINIIVFLDVMALCTYSRDLTVEKHTYSYYILYSATMAAIIHILYKATAQQYKIDNENGWFQLLYV